MDVTVEFDCIARPHKFLKAPNIDAKCARILVEFPYNYEIPRVKIPSEVKSQLNLAVEEYVLKEFALQIRASVSEKAKKYKPSEGVTMYLEVTHEVHRQCIKRAEYEHLTDQEFLKVQEKLFELSQKPEVMESLITKVKELLDETLNKFESKEVTATRRGKKKRWVNFVGTKVEIGTRT